MKSDTYLTQRFFRRRWHEKLSKKKKPVGPQKDLPSRPLKASALGCSWPVFGFPLVWVADARRLSVAFARGVSFDRMGACGRQCLLGRGFSTLVASVWYPFSLEKSPTFDAWKQVVFDEDRFRLRSVAWIARFWKRKVKSKKRAGSIIFLSTPGGCGLCLALQHKRSYVKTLPA